MLRGMKRLPVIASLLFCAHAYAGATACDTTPVNLAQATWFMLEHHPQIDQARDALEGAHADSVTAGEGPNPVLSFNSTAYNTRAGLGSGNPWQKRLDSVLRVDQTIERGGKRALRQEAAGHGAEGADADLRDTMRQLRLTVAGAYFDQLRAQQRVQIDRQLVDLQQQTETASKARLAAGDISETDEARIRVESARADSELQRALSDLDSAQIALARAMGSSCTQGLSAVAIWPNPSAETLIDDATHPERRPDVQAAQARVQQAQSLIHLAEAQRHRDVTVGLQYEHYPPDGQQLLGAGFSVPLFIFNNYDGEIARAHADAAQAEDALRQVQLDAGAEIQQARSDLRHAAERARRAASDLLPLSEKTANAMDFAYQHGAIGLLDFLDARRTLHAAQLDALDAQTDYAKALSAWQIAENLPQDHLSVPSP